MDLKELNLSEEQQSKVEELLKNKADASYKVGLAKGNSGSSATAVELNKQLEDAKTASNTAIDNLTKERDDALSLLKPFQEKEKYEKDFNGFVEAGGKKDVDLTDFNLTKYRKEDGEVEWTEFNKKHSHLLTSEAIKKDKTLQAKIVSETNEEQEQRQEEQMKKDNLLGSV